MKILKVMDLIQLNLKDLKANCNRFIVIVWRSRLLESCILLVNNSKLFESHKKLRISLGIINVQRSKELLVMVL